MTHRNLTCPDVDARLGDYLEGALDDSAVAAIELHLAGCPACMAAARDFERIVREAAALPPLTPSRDLWPSIAQRIEAPVVAIGASGGAAAATARHATARRRLRTAAMAAGLVGITALSTYLLTERRNATTLADAAAARRVAGDSAPLRDGSAAGTPTVGGSAAFDASFDSTRPATPVLAAESPDGPATAPLPAAANGVAGRSVQAVRRDPAAQARETFTGEISTLRGIVDQRRDNLDPRTIAVLEASIATIDSAIADARRALEADPASRFLSTRLDKALEKKLGLLRTAALLPART